MIQLHDYHARTRLEPRQRTYLRRHLRCFRCIDWPVLGIWLDKYRCGHANIADRTLHFDCCGVDRIQCFRECNYRHWLLQ